jgi:hypothetical protein
MTVLWITSVANVTFGFWCTSIILKQARFSIKPVTPACSCSTSLASALISKILGNTFNFQYVETNLLFAAPINLSCPASTLISKTKGNPINFQHNETQYMKPCMKERWTRLDATRTPPVGLVSSPAALPLVPHCEVDAHSPPSCPAQLPTNADAKAAPCEETTSRASGCWRFNLPALHVYGRLRSLVFSRWSKNSCRRSGGRSYTVGAGRESWRRARRAISVRGSATKSLNPEYGSVREHVRHQSRAKDRFSIVFLVFIVSGDGKAHILCV